MSKLICIDAGHGGSDPGASGNGVIEKNINLKIALRLGEILKQQGFSILFTRANDQFISLGERCQKANNNLADLFISIHVNSAANPNARGTETLCYSKNLIAEIIQKYLIDNLSTKDRGIKERPDLAVLNGTNMTAILIETAFLSNTEDAKLLKQELFLENCSNIIAKAICKYYNVEFKNYENNEDIEMKKNIEVVLNGVKTVTNGYFADGKNLFTADFIRSLGFNVSYDKETKSVLIEDNTKKIDVVVNNEKKEVSAINKGGYNFVMLKDLEKAGIIDLDYKNEIVYITKKAFD